MTRWAELGLLAPGDRIAVVSPAFAAPGFAPAVHEQAMLRLGEVTGLVPVEYPTTRRVGAGARERVADLHAAFADPGIGAVLASIGGDDQITLLPHLDDALLAAHPKPFLGYSDNTNLLNHLWRLGVPGFYGGSTQVHLGAGPGPDEVHVASLRAALLSGETLAVTDPGVSEDFGPDWLSPQALTSYGERSATEPWVWAGAARRVTARTWGGCLEVLDQLALADRLPTLAQVAGTVLLLESSEVLPDADQVNRWVRALGERGLLAAVAGVMLARPPASAHENVPPPTERAQWRAAQQEVVLNQVLTYNPEAVVCSGVPFGHTRPQWILPYGGKVTLDGAGRRILAHYR